MKNIDFYFSIGSTYTFLSVTRILDVGLYTCDKKNSTSAATNTRKYIFGPPVGEAIKAETSPSDSVNELGSLKVFPI